MKRDMDLDSWKVFCEVAQAGSISGACDALDMDASGVSRVIRALETSLGGITLFDRSIRPFRLTANGEAALVYAKRMLESHQALLESLERDPDAMRGTIHIGFPPLLLQRFLLPLLVRFHQDFPEIYLKVEEYQGPHPVNFDSPHGRFDIICGYGADPSHPNIVQIHYGNGLLVPCASPIYIANRGFPSHPEELVRHTGIIFESPMRAPVRCLIKEGETQFLRWRDEIFFDSSGSASNAALYGAGIHPGIPILHCGKAIARGELRVVLPGWTPPASKLYIYVRSESVRLKRTRVFLERYRAFMAKIHRECEEALFPFLGRFELCTDRTLP